jgi:hypothetical protein
MIRPFIPGIASRATNVSLLPLDLPSRKLDHYLYKKRMG